MWLTLTNLGRIIGSFLLGSLSLALHNQTYFSGKDTLSTIFLIMAVSFGVVLIGHFLVFMAFAWVINPIRDYCQYKGKGKKFCEKFCKKCTKL